jgi:DNA-directed RNA polymerase subunit RPC12/RpoP
MSDTKNRLEMYVAAKLEEVYKYSRPTIASGATPVEKGDVKNPYFLIECKDWNTNSFSIKDDVWHKLKAEAAADQMKDPVYIVENAKGNRLAIMDLEDWFNLIYELLEYRENDKLMSTANNECPYCGATKSLKFPCCGYFCMNCGKTFEDETQDAGNKLSEVQS